MTTPDSPSRAPVPSSVPTPVLRKTFAEVLFDLVQYCHGNHKDKLSWADDDDGFVVKDRRYLEFHILPLFFRHGRFGSLERQLANYGFRRDGRGIGAYRHEEGLFRRNQPNNIKNITLRKNKRSRDDETPEPLNEQNLTSGGLMMPMKACAEECQKKSDIAAERIVFGDADGFSGKEPKPADGVPKEVFVPKRHVDSRKMQRLSLAVLPSCIPSRGVVQRKDLVDAAAKSILEVPLGMGDESRSFQLHLVGDAASGKSTVASMVVRRNEVCSFFFDGICWISLGTGKLDSVKKIVGCYEMISRQIKLTDSTCKPPTFETDEGMDGDEDLMMAVRSEMSGFMVRRRTLVVLDDVYHLEDLQWFNFGNSDDLDSPYRVLVTTRMNLPRSDDLSVVWIPGMKEREAVAWLANVSGRTIHDDSQDFERAREIVRQCGFLPRLIRVAGEMVSEMVPNSLSLSALASKMDTFVRLASSLSPSVDWNFVKSFELSFAALGGPEASNAITLVKTFFKRFALSYTSTEEKTPWIPFPVAQRLVKLMGIRMTPGVDEHLRPLSPFCPFRNDTTAVLLEVLERLGLIERRVVFGDDDTRVFKYRLRNEVVVQVAAEISCRSGSGTPGVHQDRALSATPATMNLNVAPLVTGRDRSRHLLRPMVDRNHRPGDGTAAVLRRLAVVPRGTPKLPKYFVHRPSVREEIKNLLLHDSVSGPCVQANTSTVFLSGMVGIGKSLAAACVVHESDIRLEFSDGMSWILLTKLQIESLDDLMNIYQTIVSEIKDTDEDCDSPRFPINHDADSTTQMLAARDCMARFMADKKCLVVVDGLIHLRDAQWFDFGRIQGECRCRVLVTSRLNLGTIGGVHTPHVVQITKMKPTEAVELLMTAAGCYYSEFDYCSHAHAIAEKCDFVPFLLKIAGEMGSIRRGSFSLRQLVHEMDKVVNLAMRQNLTEVEYFEDTFKSLGEGVEAETASHVLKSFFRKLALSAAPNGETFWFSFSMAKDVANKMERNGGRLEANGRILALAPVALEDTTAILLEALTTLGLLEMGVNDVGAGGFKYRVCHVNWLQIVKQRDLE